MHGILSISGEKLSNNCSEILQLMKELNINGHVTYNKTILDGFVENGCQIHIVSQPVKEKSKMLWQICKNKYDLTCAHIDITHSENGCVLDVFRKSNCIGPEKK